MKKNIILFIVGAVISIILMAVILSVINKSNDSNRTETYSIVLEGENSIVIYDGDTYNEPGYKVYNSNNSLTNKNVVVENNINYNVPGTYEVIYSIDGKVVAKREVIVKAKKIDSKPSENFIFSLNGDISIKLLLNSEFIDPLFSAVSKNGEDVSSYVTIVGGVDTSKVGKYEIHYLLRKDNESIDLVRNVYVVDSKAEFKLNGDRKIIIDYNDSYQDPGFIATYNNKDYKDQVIVSGNVNSSVSGEYKIIYNFKTDDFVAYLTRIVLVKNEPKIIDFHLLGDEIISITRGSTFNDPFVYAKDDKDNDYSDKVVKNTDLDINSVGEYTIEYSLNLDSYSKTLIRKVIVLDKQNITFSLNGASEMSIVQGSTFNDPLFVAKDNQGNDYNSRVVIEGSVDTSKVGTYTIKYSLNVGAYNKTLSRKVTVTKKETTISFSLKGESVVNVNLNGIYLDSGFIAIDSDGNDLGSYVTVNGTVNTKKVGTYTLKFNLKYGSYNKTLTRVVNVKGSNYTVSTSNTTSGTVITIQSNTSIFDHYVTPDLKKVTTSKLTYTVTKNGKYTFFMYDKNNNKIDTIIVNVNNVDTTKPIASCTASVSNKVTTYNVTASDSSGILKYVHNGKAYTTAKFSITNDVEDDYVRVYDKAGNYIDVQCVYSAISSSGKSVIASYNSNTLKYWIEKPGTYYTVTHIWVKDAYNQMNVAVNTKFGTLETTKTIVDNTIKKYGYSNKGMVAINASGFIMSTGSNYENYVKEWRLSPTSPVIFVRGNLVRDFTGYTLPSTTPVYGMKKNGYMTYYKFGSGSDAVASNKKLLAQMKSDGIRNTASFSPVLIQNYKIMTSATDNNIRQALCQIDRNNYIIVTNTNGTNNRGVGFNHKAMAEYMIKLNCRNAYNLDGGGSTNFYYKKNNSTLSSIVTTSRTVADILYFVE